MENVEDIKATPLSLVAYQLQLLHKDVIEVRASISKLTDALAKVAVIEERQGHSIETQSSILRELEGLNLRLDNTDVRVAKTENLIMALTKEDGKMTIWVERGVWALLGLVAVFVARKVGLLS
jgi:hypothetical protein